MQGTSKNNSKALFYKSCPAIISKNYRLQQKAPGASTPRAFFTNIICYSHIPDTKYISAHHVYTEK